MKLKIKICLFLSAFFALLALPASGQRVALKHNIAGDVLLSPNIAVEIKLGGRITFDIYGSYNHFSWDDGKITWDFEGRGKMLRHWMVQPEFRLWTCEAFNGLFLGIHGHAGQHNFFGVDVPPLGLFGEPGIEERYRYAGDFYGGGLSLGYQWIIGRRWSIEASLGGGYTYMKHDVFDPADFGKAIDKRVMSFMWVTKGTLSLVFFIR